MTSPDTDEGGYGDDYKCQGQSIFHYFDFSFVDFRPEGGPVFVVSEMEPGELSACALTTRHRLTIIRGGTLSYPTLVQELLGRGGAVLPDSVVIGGPGGEGEYGRFRSHGPKKTAVSGVAGPVGGSCQNAGPSLCLG